MDILNLISWIKESRRITKAPEGSMVAVGVPNNKRDDKFLQTAMTLNDAVASGCTANNTYKTGIFDQWPFVVTPAMIKTCTRIQDTPAYPTFFAANLEGYKIGGIYELGSANSTFIVEYLGTIETTDGSYLNIFPWKTSGTVSTYPNAPLPTPVVSAFANNASVTDDNGDLVPAELMTIAIDQYSPNGADVYLIATSSTAIATINGEAAFEFEFLTTEDTSLSFTIY